MWSAGPFAAIATVVLVLTYSSDRFYSTLNDALELPHWRMQLLAGALMLAVVTETLQAGAVKWLSHKNATASSAVLAAFTMRANLLPLVSLAAIGVLQAIPTGSPIGDDIWHYTQVADALLAGQPYPIHAVGQDYQAVGMTMNYPALPLFPLLLASSFSVFGHNLAGVALPTVVATAAFPVLLYAVCLSMTGSRAISYTTAILLFLFPIYQIHLLGSPEPDTVFVTLLLAGTVIAKKATGSSLKRYWLGAGAVMGLVTLARPEGILFSVALFMSFFVWHRQQKGYWLSGLAYTIALLPFVATYYSRTGSLWPTTFGGTLGLLNLAANIRVLQDPALPWYSQAVGINDLALMALLITIAVGAVLGGFAIWRSQPDLVYIPITGLGNIAMGFFVNPSVMLAYSPVEFLRHVSFGIPFVAVSLACAAQAGYRVAIRRLAPGRRLLLVSAVMLLVVGCIYYDAQRLAKPEPYFGGTASLLWTGGGYLVTDLFSHPVSVPTFGDARTGEQLRVDLLSPLTNVSLRKVNLSEPYHWTSMLVALFGLIYASAPYLSGLRQSQGSHRP